MAIFITLAGMGSIPALAGEPRSGRSCPHPSGVYPRAGGGTQGVQRLARHWPGLSPRRRGNRLERHGDAPDWGSIPAQAGEPSAATVATPIIRVYPRAGGGTDVNPVNACSSTGLSPRRRGNPRRPLPPGGHRGSIPAQAGEPATGTSTCRSSRVYPRAGGGTTNAARGYTNAMGLSPRRRGNPGPNGNSSRPPRVYPRAGGGTAVSTAPSEMTKGLSPRRRGNLDGPCIGRRPMGSIPAQAGEPRSSCRRGRRAGVYPRAGGGTLGTFVSSANQRGLSPRRRGNPRAERPPCPRAWSIPAQAGEPLAPEQMLVRIRVYPRAGGGTCCATDPSIATQGLSPRRRGNPCCGRGARPGEGSIPAQAGEPMVRAECGRCERVYPRAGGGTDGARRMRPLRAGLSPRRRGNRGEECAMDEHTGSIPAQAGEPRRCRRRGLRGRVYPRAGGGTEAIVEKTGDLEGLSPRRRGNR